MNSSFASLHLNYLLKITTLAVQAYSLEAKHDNLEVDNDISSNLEQN